jgi:hypothetical protein
MVRRVGMISKGCCLKILVIIWSRIWVIFQRDMSFANSCVSKVGSSFDLKRREGHTTSNN